MTRRGLCALALGVLAVAVAPPASAIEFVLFGRPLRLDVTESLFLNWHGDNGQPDPTQQNYLEQLSRLNLVAATGHWLVAARFDTAMWEHTPQPGDASSDASCPNGPGRYPCLVTPGDARLLNRFQSRPFWLEKLAVEYTSRDVEVTVGDFYLTFGRGLVLSIHKLDELGVDTTLRGAKVQWHKGDFGAVAAFGWANIQNVDEATTYYTNLPSPTYDRFGNVSNDGARTRCLWLVVGCNDFLVAEHADYRIADRVAVGAQGLVGVPWQPTPPDVKEYPLQQERLFGGLYVDAPRLTDWLAVYAEYAERDNFQSWSEVVDKGGNAIDRGRAFYASSTAYVGRMVMLLEFKDYANYQPWYVTVDGTKSPVAQSLVYQQPPTLERVITQIATNTDVIAGRARVDYRLSNSLLFFASVEVGEDSPAQNQNDLLVDSYVGTEVRWNEGRSHFFPFFGWRHESNQLDGSLVESLYAVEWDGAQALAHGWSVETQGLLWFRDKPLSGMDNPWTDGNVYVSLKRTPYFVAVAGYEFTTDAAQSLNQNQFLSGSLQWNITPATSVRLFAGGNRPGLKCISGVCRVFPAFEGGRLELVLRL